MISGKRLSLLVLFTVVLSDLVAICQQKKQYELVWTDEFNMDGAPDSSKWNYERGFVRNNEDQWYQPENVVCKNGLLIIEARRVRQLNPWYEAGSSDWRRKRDSIHYTSACMITRDKHSWKYGRFEMRGKIDIRSGMWPAWWTLGVEKDWPANGEIDIMEYYRDQLLANMVCLGKEGKQEWHTEIKAVTKLGGAEWAAKFHVWRMDWSEEWVALYVDDILLNKVATDSLVNKDESGFNPFKQPHYMLLNLAIGGQNGGDPGNTNFPGRFEVDYVRVYREK